MKKVFDKSMDGNTHIQFQKFSKGEFRDRAVISAKQSKGKFTIYTTSEFANDLVKDVAEKLGDSKTKVTGAIVSTSDLTGELKFEDKKQFQGVKRYLIESDMSGKEILDLLEKFPKSFFALSFEADEGNTKLKIKPKAPKSGKPGSKDGESKKPDFCKLITTDKEIGSYFIFEKPDFQKADINHTFLIEGLVMPKGETDYAKMRELAKRKGKIIRKAIIDEKDMSQEFEFEA